MADWRQESPGKTSHLAFRFRAGEEDLEELNVNDSDDNREDSWKKFTGKLQKKVVSKFLNSRDHLSSSESEEDTTSDKLLDNDTSKGIIIVNEETIPEASTEGRRSRLPSSELKERKREQKRQKRSSVVVESGVEAEEDLDGWSVPTPTPAPSLTPPPVVKNCVFNSFFNFSSFFQAIGWLLPLTVASCLPLPQFWSGVLCGVLFVALVRDVSRVFGGSSMDACWNGPFTLPDYRILPPLKVRPLPEQKTTYFNVYLKAYDPDSYTVSQTRVANVALDESMLKLSWSSKSISRRAHFLDPPCAVDESKAAVYDLTKTTVSLQPEGLAKKRLFSKKYPIVVSMNPDAIVSINEDSFHTLNFSNPINQSLLRASLHKTSFSMFGKPSSSQQVTEDLTISPPPSPYLDVNTPPVQFVIYLFARCDREKEDWYQRLVKASTQNATTPSKEKLDNDKNNNEDMSNDVNGTNEKEREFTQYLNYMARFTDLMSDEGEESQSLPRQSNLEIDGMDLQWFNAVLNRVLFDVFRSEFWTTKIQEKLQKKLSAIRIPYYIEEMQIADMNLGKIGPIFHRASRPCLDSRGLWIDLDMTYEGLITFSIQTQCDFIKLQKGGEEESISNDKAKSPVYDSDVEDTAESSEDQFDDEIYNDEESVTNLSEDFEMVQTPKRRTSQKFFKIMENVAKSTTFRHVANNRVVQRAIQGISKTKLKLIIEVKSLAGTLAINIPPPPSERVWIGFRGTPRVWLTATPQLGDRTVKITAVSRWIERKLIHEFQTLMVLPNMRSLTLPLFFRKGDYPSGSPPGKVEVIEDIDFDDFEIKKSDGSLEDRLSFVLVKGLNDLFSEEASDNSDERLENLKIESRKSVKFSAVGKKCSKCTCMNCRCIRKDSASNPNDLNEKTMTEKPIISPTRYHVVGSCPCECEHCLREEKPSVIELPKQPSFARPQSQGSVNVDPKSLESTMHRPSMLSVLKDTANSSLHGSILSGEQLVAETNREASESFRPPMSFFIPHSHIIMTNPVKFENMNFTSRKIAEETDSDKKEFTPPLSHIVTPALHYPKPKEMEFHKRNQDNFKIEPFQSPVIVGAPILTNVELEDDVETKDEEKADLTLNGFLPSTSKNE